MKIKALNLYIFEFYYTAFMFEQIDLNNIDGIAIKFILMALVVPFIGVYLLYKDENSDNPNKFDIIASVLCSIILVWLGYEVSNETTIPVWLCLMSSFLCGLFSLPLILRIKKNFIGKGGLVDTFFKNLENYMNKFFKNGK